MIKKYYKGKNKKNIKLGKQLNIKEKNKIISGIYIIKNVAL